MLNAMPLPSERDSRLYVEDMLGFCDTVLDYTQGLDQASFAADRMRVDATLRNLALIGEAAPVSPQTSAPWRPTCRGARWWAPATA